MGAPTLAASLDGNPATSAPVGALVLWTVSVPASSPDLWCRFRARAVGGLFRTVRDFGPCNSLGWTALEEGFYEVEVAVRDRITGDSADAISTFELVSRLSAVAGPRAGSAAVVNATSHPLVALYSAPGCEVGRASVEYRSQTSVLQRTPDQACRPGRSLNFYLAALAPNTGYIANLVLDRGRGGALPASVEFQTGDAPDVLKNAAFVVEAANPSAPQPILLQAPLYLPAIATDLAGRLLWFGPMDLTYLTHPGSNGTFFGLREDGIDPALDVVREFDLVGATVRETNVARINEQLLAQGKRTISAFHHEARPLSDGRIVVLAEVEQVLTDVQGPGAINVLGDMIVVLDENLQVVWTWDAFDHLDVRRRAVLGETCFKNVGCAPHYLPGDANDWTHGNSVDETPDGSLLYSSRHQDWLIKIDYRRGSGGGEVIWRLGRDGDFSYDSGDSYPWFSHQHDASYEAGGAFITVFDNGNTRILEDAGGSSRGQVVQLDEDHRIARLLVNVDLGVFSPALGSAQRLVDGTYHFNAGFVPAGQAVEAFSLQVDDAGNVLSSIAVPAAVYRSFRMEDLYHFGATPDRASPRIIDWPR